MLRLLGGRQVLAQIELAKESILDALQATRLDAASNGARKLTCEADSELT